MIKILAVFFVIIVAIPHISSADTNASCPIVTTYLTIGSRSAQVIALKKYFISEKLLPTGLSTNYFGPATQTALKTWQKKKGIEPTGATGPKTRAGLKVCGAVAVTVPQVKPDSKEQSKTTTPTLVLPKLLLPSGGGAQPSVCTAQTQTRIQPCPGNQVGAITESRTIICPEQRWGVWTEQSRTCAGGVTPSPETSKNCVLNGATIMHQGAVSMYEKKTVPTGQSCKSETRTCTNGIMSGTYTEPACTVAVPEMSLVSSAQSVQKGSSVILTWNSTYTGGCGLYRGASTLLSSDVHGVLTIPNMFDPETFSLWCRTIASDPNSAVVQRVSVTVTDAAYKMSDYWPTVQQGINLIRHYDSWLVQVLYKEQTSAYTYNIVDYVFDAAHPQGALESLWRIRIDASTGRVDEIGDYCPPGNYSGDCTWYNPELPIIWGTALTIGQTISAPYGAGYESLTLQGHYDSIELGGVTYTDVIKLRVNQRYGANNAVGVDLDYYFQKNFGTVRTVLINDILHPEKNGTMWTLSKSCATSTPGQLTCP